MKKSLYFLSLLLICSLSISYFFYLKFVDSQGWSNLEQKDKLETFYIHPNEAVNQQDLYEGFQRLVNNYPISIIKNDYEFRNQDTVLVKSILSGERETAIYQVSLTAGEFISEEQPFQIMSTTGDIGPEVSGIIFDLFADDLVEIWTLEKYFNEKKQLFGEYRIVSTVAIESEGLLNDLARETKIPLSELMEQRVFSRPILPLIIFLSLGFGSFFCLLFLLFLIFYTLQYSKKISVLRLQGWRIKEIIWKVMEPFISSSIFISLTYTLIFSLIIKQYTFKVILKNLLLQFVVIGVLSFVSSLVILVVIRGSLKNHLKNKLNLKPILVITYLFRLGFIFASVASLNYLTLAATEGLNTYRELGRWQDIGDYQVLLSSEIGDDLASYTQGHPKLFDDSINYWRELNQLGAYYITSEWLVPVRQFVALESQSIYDPRQSQLEKELAVLSVNINYFNEIAENHEWQSFGPFKESEDKMILLIPESQESETAEIVKIMQAWKIEESVAYYGFRNQKLPSEELVNLEAQEAIIYYYQDQDIFSYQPVSEETSQGILASPIVTVLTTANVVAGFTSDTIVSGISSGVKLPADWTVEKLAPVQEKYDLTDNKLVYGPIITFFAEEIRNNRIILSMISLGLIVITSLTLTVIYFLVVIILQIKKQKIVIQKLMGMAVVYRYQLFFLIPMIGYVFSLGSLLLVGSLNLASLLLWLMLVVVDFLVSYTFIKKKEQQSLVSLIKGEH